MPTIRQLIQTSPAKATELFTKLAETSGNAVKTRERLFSELKAHHLSVAAALQSCGKGCSVWSRLAMRRRPRVNQDVMLRSTRLGCWSGRLRSAGVAWWRASHWPVETAR